MLDHTNGERRGHRECRQSRSEAHHPLLGAPPAQPPRARAQRAERVVTRACVDDPHQDFRQVEKAPHAGDRDEPHLDADEAAQRDSGSAQEAQLVERVATVGQTRPSDGPHAGARTQLARDTTEP